MFVTLLFSHTVLADDLSAAVKSDYDEHLAALFEYFHRNPELSTMETKTAARLAEELRMAGFEVTEGVGGTPVPSHHSPFFKVKAEESVVMGVEATVVALKDLLQVIAR